MLVVSLREILKLTTIVINAIHLLELTPLCLDVMVERNRCENHLWMNNHNSYRKHGRTVLCKRPRWLSV